MTNQFDFYLVEVSAETKTALKLAGVKRDEIRSDRIWGSYRVYGNKRYPRIVYRSTVGFFDATREGSAQAETLREQWAAKGVTARVLYHIDD